MKGKVISETPITLGELKDHVDHIKERDSEINFRVERTEDYLNTFLKLTPKKSAELKKKLEALAIPRMKETLLVKIVDLLPKNLDEIKSIVQGYPVSISADNLKKILEVVDAYQPKKGKKGKEEETDETNDSE